MQLDSPRLERALKSFGLSVALFLLWGALTGTKAIAVFRRFDWTELVWVLYNGAIAILFLVRSTPSRVSMDPLHWLVALVTSFSGLFLRRGLVEPTAAQSAVAESLIMSGLALGLATAVTLGRSYDFLPALRGVETRGVYRIVRHPMYLASIVIRMGYLVLHPSGHNLTLFTVMIYLYHLRTRFEEAIMVGDERYRDYLSRVRWRFLPGVY